jgi:diguanylate cyclase (GGDEF)-like protein
LNRAQRYSQHLALVVVDLHQFKEVNDRYGHPRGDALLQTAADTLRKSLRTSDYAFRIGGDEFALLLVQSDLEQAATLARRIRANFAAAIQPMQVTGNLGLDYGIAIFPQDGDQTELLMRVADERLYEMKHTLRAAGMAPQVVAPLPRRPVAPVPSPAPSPLPSKTAPAPVPVSAPPPRPKGTEQRKWERVSLSGTHAYAQLSDNPQQSARVLDLGYGGVAFETGGTEELGSTFYAILHVPILPPVRVSLKRLYQIRTAGGLVRTGCAFVT